MKQKPEKSERSSLWYPLIAFLIVAGACLALYGTYKVRQHMNYQRMIAAQKKYDEENNPVLKHERKFIKQVADPSVKLYKQDHKVLPSIVIAQAILESNWGKSKLYTEANNPFGIKGTYNGDYIMYETGEYINHKHITEKAQFRKYPDLQSAIEDHNEALYEKFLKRDDKITDYREEAKLLQKNTYATDPDYANKLIRVIKAHDLQKYDQEAMK
ncbi:glycoside hydrolase family 73 protein [Fructilactobacillus cliffordii]|uniref:Glucosaminidase domain-containing protein n=1 Tax=Fructilactobacillus cliffordii TaxID=2940299 RepID=A0A9Q8ZPH7_9LACO|nr:glucosaminidase domain-containing protein [Fructilactobacillus cliffordii]USS86107.1 glucosaminidase domain-containing protein [Fructilactobacillus cliffordii]USS89184.1 glucosaminidase domain-containing protein [Fructilactobacillus cliffordii]